jgi:glycosyltransferase involved in cell wall biosynthesis
MAPAKPALELSRVTSMRRVRVVHVAESAGWAGGEVYLRELARTLDRTRVTLAVISAEEGPLVPRLRALGVETVVLPLAGRLGSPGALVALARQLRAMRPHIVQSHGARTNVYARLACRLAGVPRHVSTVHNSLYDYPVGALRRTAYLLADRATTPLSARIVCVARSLARDLIERSRVPASRVVVIPNGVDLARFDPAAVDGVRVRAELGLGDAPVIGIVGRMTPQKSHADFVAAFDLLRGRVPASRALIVGDGPLRGDIEGDVRARGLAQACVLAGVRDDIPECLAAMSVVALSSVSEGFPFTVLEALAMARPLAASAVNGVTEIVEPGDNGLLVPPRRPDLLSEALATLLEDPVRAAALGRAGRKTVESRYALNLMADRLMQLYEELS